MEDMNKTMVLTLLCGFGQAAAVPALDSLKYLRDEYANRIDQSLFLRGYLDNEAHKSKEGVI